MNKNELDKAIASLSIIKPDNADGRENHWKRKDLEGCLVNQGTPKTSIIIQLGDKKNREDRLTAVLEKLPKFRLFSNDKTNSLGGKANSAVIANEIKSIIAEHMKSDFEEINKKMQEGMQEKLQKLNNT